MMRTFQLTAAFDNLSVVDNLVLSYFRAHEKPTLLHLLFNTCRAQRNKPKVVETLETFDLADKRDRLVKNLSLGEKRRLEIAMAVLAEPKVLLLDEPLAGLSESEIQCGSERAARARRPSDHPDRRAQDLARAGVPAAADRDARRPRDRRRPLRGDPAPSGSAAEATGRSKRRPRERRAHHERERQSPRRERAERRLWRIEGAVRRRHHGQAEPGGRLRRPQRRRQDHAAQDHRRLPQAELRHGHRRRREPGRADRLCRGRHGHQIHPAGQEGVLRPDRAGKPRARQLRQQGLRLGQGLRLFPEAQDPARPQGRLISPAASGRC